MNTRLAFEGYVFLRIRNSPERVSSRSSNDEDRLTRIQIATREALLGQTREPSF